MTFDPLAQVRTDLMVLHARCAPHVASGDRMFIHLAESAEAVLRAAVYPQPLEEWLASLDPPALLS